MAASIQKSTSCFSLRVKYLRRRCCKSVRGDVSDSPLKTTSKPANNCADGGGSQLEYRAASPTPHPTSSALLSVLISAFFASLSHRVDTGTKGELGCAATADEPVVRSLLCTEKKPKKTTQQVWRVAVLIALWLDSCLFSTHRSMPEI